MNNRLHNSSNPYQGPSKKVLCLCSAGLLRSPTTAFVLGQDPYNYNTRAAGVEKDFALIPVDEVLLHWADEIVCVEPSVMRRLYELFPDMNLASKLKVLNLPDMYSFRDHELVAAIKEQYEHASAP